MHDVFETVDGRYLAFAAFVGASDDSDFVILSDWDRSDLSILLESSKPFLRQREATHIVLLT